MQTKSKTSLLPKLQTTVEELVGQFDRIPAVRKVIIDQLTQFIQEKVRKGDPVLLNFICTHNSRRSHLAQIWAQAAAYYYGIEEVYSFSGGTEATAFNLKAVRAMKQAGFEISATGESENPTYEVTFSKDAPALIAYSKRYDDPANPNGDFAAIMTCSHADQDCPFVPGASKRIALTYDDPKYFDGTPLEEEKYLERVFEIGREVLYAFSQVK